MRTRLGQVFLASLLLVSLATLWTLADTRSMIEESIVPEQQQSQLCITTSWYTRAIDGSCSLVSATTCREEGQTVQQLKAQHIAEVAAAKVDLPVAGDCPEDE